MTQKQKFTVQIKCPIVVSKEIKAESFEEALAIAKKLAQSEEGARPSAGWAWEWSEDFEVTAVLR